jgi:hypothetical protein
MPSRPKGTGLINKRQTQLISPDALARGTGPITVLFSYFHQPRVKFPSGGGLQVRFWIKIKKGEALAQHEGFPFFCYG